MRGWLIATLYLLTSCTDSFTNSSSLVAVTSQATTVATKAMAVALPTLPSCPLTNYSPTNALSIAWTGNEFLTDKDPFRVHGIFLNEEVMSGTFGDLVDALRLIADAGFNTITVTLNVEQDTNALDRLFALAAEYRLRIIFSISTDQEIADIVVRYFNEPTLLAWEIMRQEPDLQLALVQLSNTRITIRTCNQHPIIAAWEYDLISTAPLVDILGVVHGQDYESLRQQFANVTAATDKPIYLARIGYDANIVGDRGQRSLVFQALEEAANYQALGWTVFSAFDGNNDAMGIWDKNSKPRLALEAVQHIIARDEAFTPSS